MISERLLKNLTDPNQSRVLFHSSAFPTGLYPETKFPEINVYKPLHGFVGESDAMIKEPNARYIGPFFPTNSDVNLYNPPIMPGKILEEGWDRFKNIETSKLLDFGGAV